jgi:hypothetical protein
VGGILTCAPAAVTDDPVNAGAPPSRRNAS